MTGIRIRQALPAEAATLHRLIRRAMAFYAEKSQIKTPLDADLESAADLAVHIRHDLVLVAQEQDELVGTVRLVRQDKATAWFTRFAVLPEKQRSGIGQLLLEAAVSQLRQQGCRQLLLHTALTNQQLVGFYQARGFVLLHTSNERGYPRGLFLKQLDQADPAVSVQQGADPFIDQSHDQGDKRSFEEIKGDKNKDY